MNYSELSQDSQDRAWKIGKRFSSWCSGHWHSMNRNKLFADADFDETGLILAGGSNSELNECLEYYKEHYPESFA